MSTEDRKRLSEEYKLRKPDMGVIALRCKATGDLFLAASKDTKADINSNSFKMRIGGHPNKEINALYKAHGAENMEFSVYRELEYEDLTEDQTKKLEALLEECMAETPGAGYIWRVKK